MIFVIESKNDIKYLPSKLEDIDDSIVISFTYNNITTQITIYPSNGVYALITTEQPTGKYFIEKYNGVLPTKGSIRNLIAFEEDGRPVLNLDGFNVDFTTKGRI